MTVETKKMEVIATEEDVKTLSELVADSVNKLNAVFRTEGGANVADLKEAEETAKLYISAWNIEKRHEMFSEWLTQTEDTPLRYALRQRDVEQKSLKFSAATEKKAAEYSVKSHDTMFNVMEFAEYAAKDNIHVFHDEAWKDCLEAITKRLVIRVCRDVENKTAEHDIEKDYCLKAGSLELWNEAKSNKKDPYSNKQLKISFQQMIDKMLGDDSLIFENKDLKFVLLTMAKRGKGKASLATPRLSTMVQILTDCLHRGICDKEYCIEVVQESFASDEK